MIVENVFEMSQFDGSSMELLWKNPNSMRNTPPMSSQTIKFNRGEYPLLLVVARRVYLDGAGYNQNVVNSASYSILVNDATFGRSQTINGDGQFIQTSLGGSTYTYEGFLRTATVVEEGLTISDCKWKYGTYNGSVNINAFVIPYQIYGIR